MTKPIRIALLAATAAMILPSGGAMVFSDRTFVFLRPETSSFWRTATNDVVTVPIDLPWGESSATLSVSGVNYHRVYENLAGGPFDLHLPPADSPETENVYDLVLTFDKGGSRTAKIGLIKGRLSGACSTRCLAPETGSAWRKVGKQAVLPIPYGTTEFSVSIGGETVASDSGLDGAQGWYAIGPVKEGAQVALSLDGDEVSLVGARYGSLVIVK